MRLHAYGLWALNATSRKLRLSVALATPTVVQRLVGS
jgi:hypothetical protein